MPSLLVSAAAATLKPCPGPDQGGFHACLAAIPATGPHCQAAAGRRRALLIFDTGAALASRISRSGRNVIAFIIQIVHYLSRRPLDRNFSSISGICSHRVETIASLELAKATILAVAAEIEKLASTFLTSARP
jgi:hypothetical protein